MQSFLGSSGPPRRSSHFDGATSARCSEPCAFSSSHRAGTAHCKQWSRFSTSGALRCAANHCAAARRMHGTSVQYTVLISECVLCSARKLDLSSYVDIVISTTSKTSHGLYCISTSSFFTPLVNISHFSSFFDTNVEW